MFVQKVGGAAPAQQDFDFLSLISKKFVFSVLKGGSFKKNALKKNAAKYPHRPRLFLLCTPLLTANIMFLEFTVNGIDLILT